ncbi:HEAT repeat domain-containing protein, partial [Bacteroidota bacterium]
EEFLAFCGTAGLGELIGGGLNEYLPDLRKQASDPRWRIREAVAMGLQIIGKHNFTLFKNICQEWVSQLFAGL